MNKTILSTVGHLLRRPVFAIHLTVKTLGLLGTLVLVADRASAQLAQDFDLKDGPIADIAAPADATLSPGGKRVWLAQGRVLAALRVSDGARMRSENQVFMNGSVQTRPISIEIDDANNLLYVLTDANMLYRENIANPAIPVQTGSLDLSVDGLGMPSGLVGKQIKVWGAAPDAAIFVLGDNKIAIIKDVGGTLAWKNATTQVLPLNDSTFTLPPGATSITPLRVGLFDHMFIQKDGHGLVAYINAYMGGYEPTPVQRPFPRCLLLCDLDSANNYQNPKFTFSSGGFTQFMYWNFEPCQPAPGPCLPPGQSKYDYSANDVWVAHDGSAYIAYVGCGKVSQLQRIDVTNAFTTGTLVGLVPAIDVDPTHTYQLNRVVVDPTNAKRVFVSTIGTAGGPGDLHILDVTNPSAPVNNGTGLSEPFSASAGDLPLIAMQGHPQTLWAGLSGSNDRLIKLTDVGSAIPTVFQRYAWPWHCDGAVALTLPSDNSIYLPNFGGVQRYKQQASFWVPDPAGFQSTVLPGTTEGYATEHIEIGRNVLSVGDDRVFTCTGHGSFEEFKLDPVTHNPLPPTLAAMPPKNQIDPFWSDTDDYYSNDVSVAVIGTTTYVLTDIVNMHWNQMALLGWAWDPTSVPPKWKFAGSALWDSGYYPGTIPNYPKAIFSETIDVARGAGNQTFAFVTYTTGFFSVNISGLATGTGISLASGVDTWDPANNGTTLCRSSAHSLDRVMVTFEGVPNAGSAGAGLQTRVYSWDGSTGIVNPTPVTTLDTAQVCTQSAGVICDIGASAKLWGRTFRMRYLTLDAGTGCGLIEMATDGGVHLELKYSGSHNTLPANNDILSYSNYWKGDYNGAMQDCRAYDFGSGTRLLVSKDGETFAIVQPSTATCP
jgi:hypothetical protein